MWTTTAGLFVRVDGVTVGPLAASGGSGGGLDYITSGTSTSASSLSVDSCFSSTYDAYRIIVDVVSGAAAQYVRLRLRASGTDLTSGYIRQYIQAYNQSLSASTGSSTDVESCLADSGKHIVIAYDIIGPALADHTEIIGLAYGRYESYPYMRYMAASIENTTAYDGISLVAGSGSFSSVTIRIYGYAKS